MTRAHLTWHTEQFGELKALEPTPECLLSHAEWLAKSYNEPFNADMMGNETLSIAADVIAYYESGQREGRRMFLLFVNDELVGDADFRNFFSGGAEFAIAIGARGWQGKNLGTNFGIMLHSFAFDALKLDTIIAAIIPKNVGSLRMFEKLGYTRDLDNRFREHLEDDGDVCVFLNSAQFSKVRSGYPR
jgi:RimJ/RimL family protein N-acetyltransferase